MKFFSVPATDDQLLIDVGITIVQLLDINKKCLAILAEIMWRTSEAQQSLPAGKALTLTGIATVFAAILFADVTFPGGADSPYLAAQRVGVCSNCLVFMVTQRVNLFPPLR